MASSIETYAPLWVKTNYSFLEGASHPEELVERAVALGLRALASTDRDGVYGLAHAHVHAKKVGLPILAGTELRTGERRVVLLAETREGYARMCRLITIAHARCEKGDADARIEEIAEAGAAGGIVALVTEPDLLAALRDAYRGALYAMCARHRQAGDPAREARLRAAARASSVPTVAATEVLYHVPARRELQDMLTCIRHGVTLSTAGTLIKPNAEHELKPVEAMRALYADEIADLRRTLEIAERCRFSLSEVRYRYPAERLPEGHTESDWLRELAMRGARARYAGAIPDDAREQIERELELIGDLDYGGYFLTMHEIVEFCRAHAILCQGRGSAANSIVCYCLGITAIDPVRMDLLFERFLSRERAEPPDIDLDIEHERREEVIQHVYERYGRSHAAMVANVIRYRLKSAVRDVGKALGIPLTEVDRMAKMIAFTEDSTGKLALDVGIDPNAPAAKHLGRLATEILDFPRHLSIHPGGFLLGHEPVDTLVPIEPGAMEKRTVVQWDKYDIENLGLFKVDLLGLGTLTHIHYAFDLIREHESRHLTLATVPAEDAATYDMISAGDTVGVFQIESRAQMAMLPRLKPKTFYDLVIEVAIVRPGPIQGDMVHPYLRRRTGEEPLDYPHPSLERVLKKTLGVPIFQEQVMKLAVLAADYTPGEADQLRRDMAAWRSSGRIEQHHDRIVERMTAHGIPREFAERVFSQIRGFGEYGFPESHAASFALLAYVTAWLRCHHPAAFTCALLNAQPMGFYAPSTIVEDARRRGVVVRAIDVEESAWDCTMEDGAVRIGLRYVKGFGTRERAALERAPRPYGSIESFVRRARLSERALCALAEAGGFDSLGLNRRDALWAIRAIAKEGPGEIEYPARESAASFRAPSLPEEIAWDYRTSDHSTRGHPMEALRATLRARGLPDAHAVRGTRDGRRLDYVGLVICRQQPQTASGVTFYTLEDETGFVNVVVWRDVFESHRAVARTAHLLGISGRIQSAEGVVHLVADKLWVPSFEVRAAPRSRDFH